MEITSFYEKLTLTNAVSDNVGAILPNQFSSEFITYVADLGTIWLFDVSCVMGCYLRREGPHGTTERKNSFAIFVTWSSSSLRATSLGSRPGWNNRSPLSPEQYYVHILLTRWIYRCLSWLPILLPPFGLGMLPPAGSSQSSLIPTHKTYWDFFLNYHNA